MTVCKGCLITGDCDMLILDSIYKEKCPCRTCPVKVVCSENVCDDFAKLIRLIYTNREFVAEMKAMGRPTLVSQNRVILRERPDGNSI